MKKNSSVDPNDTKTANGKKNVQPTIPKEKSAEVLKLEEMFNYFDQNKNGTISKDELQRVFQAHGKVISAKEIDDIIRIVDINQDGKINFAGFCGIAQNHGFVRRYNWKTVEKSLLKHLKELFEVFDVDGSGTISSSEFRQLIQKIINLINPSYKCFNEDIINQMILFCDQNGDGEIDFEGFQKLISENSEMQKLIMAIVEPGAIDFLKMFSDLPKSLRQSFTEEKMLEGSVSADLFLRPAVSGGLYLKDLALDPSKNDVKQNTSLTFWLNLKEAKNIPSPPARHEKTVFERKANICLLNDKEIVSNIYSIPCEKQVDGWWKFREVAPENNVVLRTYMNPDKSDLQLLIELVVVITDNDNNAVGFSCGWCKIKFNPKEFRFNQTKKYELFAGTPWNPVNIEPDDIPKATDIVDVLMEKLVGKTGPSLTVKIYEADTQKKKLFSRAPPQIITSSDSIKLLTLYRQLLARELLANSEKEKNLCLVNSVLFSSFHKILNDQILWRILVVKWRDFYFKLPKKKKKDFELLKKELQKYVGKVWSILTLRNTENFPSFPTSEKKRMFLENLFEKVESSHWFLKTEPETFHTPFDPKNEVLFDCLS